MTTRILIALKTAAEESVKQKVSSNNPLTIIAFGTLGSDTVPIQVSYDDGGNWIDCWKDGLQVQLATDNNPVTVYGPCVIRVNKGITSAAVGVALSTEP